MCATHQVQRDFYYTSKCADCALYLYARHYGGTFIRIEDTDHQASCRRRGERSQLENLRWLGIDWDESQKRMKNTANLNVWIFIKGLYQWPVAEKEAAYKSYVTEEKLARA